MPEKKNIWMLLRSNQGHLSSKPQRDLRLSGWYLVDVLTRIMISINGINNDIHVNVVVIVVDQQVFVVGGNVHVLAGVLWKNKMNFSEIELVFFCHQDQTNVLKLNSHLGAM